MASASSYFSSLYACNFPNGRNTDVNILVCAASTCPYLKKRYCSHVEMVRKYLESIKDFDVLISPQSLFLHFLGLVPSNHIRKNVEIVKKSKFVESSFE